VQISKKLVPPIESPGVGAEKPFHPGHQVSSGRFDHQMEMIAHETERMHLPAGLGARLAQCPEKASAILLIAKDRLAAEERQLKLSTDDN
jgi:hypothetical protein